MGGINLSGDTREHSFNDDKTLNVTRDGNYSLSAKYHKSEIEQNETVINNAVGMVWVGIAFLAVGMFLAMFSEQKILALVPGAFVDIFSGTMIYLVNKSSESKRKYFENLSIVEHEQRIIELIHSSDNQQFRERMIAKIVDRHCKN